MGGNREADKFCFRYCYCTMSRESYFEFSAHPFFFCWTRDSDRRKISIRRRSSRRIPRLSAANRPRIIQKFRPTALYVQKRYIIINKIVYTIVIHFAKYIAIKYQAYLNSKPQWLFCIEHLSARHNERPAWLSLARNKVFLSHNHHSCNIRILVDSCTWS